MVKQGDVYVRQPDSQSPKLLLNLQWDSASMCATRNAIIGVLIMVKQCYDDTVDLKSEMFFDDPASIIDVVMMEGKEEITCMHYMFDELFREYNPNKTYDIICGKNEYVIEEGLFPNKFKLATNRECTLCDKYQLENFREIRRNVQNTRDVWIHPDIGTLLRLSADNKATSEIMNVMKSCCRFCKAGVGKKQIQKEDGFKLFFTTQYMNLEVGKKCARHTMSGLKFIRNMK